VQPGRGLARRPGCVADRSTTGRRRAGHRLAGPRRSIAAGPELRGLRPRGPAVDQILAGAGVCPRCRRRELAQACVRCGVIKPVAGRDHEHGAVCARCADRPERTCGRCGRVRRIARRAHGEEPDVCDLCFRMPSADCSLCGRHRPCAFASTAAPVCAGCALRRVIACARCGKLAPPTANWPEGPVCDPCYNAALRRRGTCAGCQANRRLVAPPGPDANLCAPTLLVPTLGRTTGPAIDGDQRWTLLARLLHDHDVDLTDRVAGSLLLSYGQQLSRIAVMTTDQIHHHADSVSVRFGSCDITVPEPLAGLLTELIDTGRRYRGVGSPATPSRWLFPGHLPGRPITPARLGERLRAVGLRALPGRRATQLQLASEVPAAVLADLLHLSPGTATRWTRDVGGDWSRYAASIALARGHGG